MGSVHPRSIFMLYWLLVSTVAQFPKKVVGRDEAEDGFHLSGELRSKNFFRVDWKMPSRGTCTRQGFLASARLFTHGILS